VGRKDADARFLGQGKLEKEEFDQFLQDGRLLVDELMHSILAGRYQPQPADEKHCQRCDWKTICRHPNLHH